MLHDIDYLELEKRSKSLSGPFASVQSAFELFGLKHSSNGQNKCSPTVLKITYNRKDGSNSYFDVERPQVLISGEIHGDERVGPSVSIVMAELLVHSGLCEIERSQSSCDYLSGKDISLLERKWLAFLVSRREIIIIPTANCLGYIQNRRDDNGIDPNRDFGYSRSDNNCLKSATSQLFHSLMSDNLIQTAVTFHGGMVAIGYEWGSKNHMKPNDKSPDDVANVDIANHMSVFAGSFRGEKNYPVGRMNSLVYPVEGGMEDWMYAAGWDKAVLKKCNDYDSEKQPQQLQWQQTIKEKKKDLTTTATTANTTVNSNNELILSSDNNNNLDLSSSGNSLDVENRAVVFLIETSDAKRPKDNQLGGDKEILNPKSIYNGHVPRNFRLALVAADVAQPYMCYSSVKVSYNSYEILTTAIESSRKTMSSLHQSSRRRLDNNNNNNNNNVNNNINDNYQHEKIQKRRRQRRRIAKRKLNNSSTSNNSSKQQQQRQRSIFTIEMDWFVGGSFHTDATWLTLHKMEATTTTATTATSQHDDADHNAANYGDTTRDWTQYINSLTPPLLSSSSSSSSSESVNNNSINSNDSVINSNRISFPFNLTQTQSGSTHWTSSSSNNGNDRYSSSTTGATNLRKLSSSSSSASSSFSLFSPHTFTSNRINLAVNIYTDYSFQVSSTRVKPTAATSSNTMSSSSSSSPSKPAIITTATANANSNNNKNDHNDIETDMFLTPGVYQIIGWSVVDQHWRKPSQGQPLNMNPQSILVNARTNTSWHMIKYDTSSSSLSAATAAANDKYSNNNNNNNNNNNKRKIKSEVKGRKHWSSDPIIFSVNAVNGIQLISATINCSWWHNEKINIMKQSLYNKESSSSFSSTHHIPYSSIFSSTSATNNNSNNSAVISTISNASQANDVVIITNEIPTTKTTGTSNNTNDNSYNLFKSATHPPVVYAVIDESGLYAGNSSPTTSTSATSSNKLVLLTVLMISLATAFFLFRLLEKYLANKRRGIKLIHRPNNNNNNYNNRSRYDSRGISDRDWERVNMSTMNEWVSNPSSRV